jgi:type IV pilus assembly protein PilC
MIFNYKAIDSTGAEREGTIEAVNIDIAISSLQRRGMVISTIKSPDDSSLARFQNLSIFKRVSSRDVVILSRQMSILFEAQVSALRIFRLLASEAENPIIRKALVTISDDLQGGSSISKALEKHSTVFTAFYVNMVKAGEESGKLDQTFLFLADYLDRNYEITSKARNALIYPAFVIVTFIAVMILMFVAIIPKIGAILQDSGQTLPIYTRVVLGISGFFVHYGIYAGLGAAVIAVLGARYLTTASGRESFDSFKISIPYIGSLYRKLYLSRIADNMNTMLISGISMVKALEVTSSVVGNKIFADIIDYSIEAVKGGSSLSDAFNPHKEIPGIMVQMIKVGEETGELGGILKTLSKFYQREVVNAVDTLVDLIEPVMIVVLGLGVGILLASVLVPIYNVAGSF